MKQLTMLGGRHGETVDPIKEGDRLMTKEEKAIARATRERDRFDATWGEYVAQLERLEDARAQVRALNGAPGHAYRTMASAAKQVKRLHAILTRDYGMDLGSVVQ